jgi:3-oxoacyl-[acyl-carrier-protein] synthase-3
MARLNAVITGWGFYVPPKVLTNADVARMVVDARARANLPTGPQYETSDEWITKNTGIKERRIASDGEVTSTMATKAAKRALEKAHISARDVDAIVVATATPDYLFPATACLVQAQIGAPRAAAFDVEAACTGFLSGLAIARGLIVSGASETVLVIGAETLSRFIDWSDRGTCILFADGAGAAVVEASNASAGIESTILRGDGSEAHLLLVPGGGARHPASDGSSKNGMHFIRMDGPSVFKLAVRHMAHAAVQAIEEAGLRLEDIDLFIPHQANIRIIDAVANRLRLDPKKVFVNIDKYGNTSAASIPIALCEAVEQGRVKRGDRLLFVAFGAGFTWGAAVTEWFGAVEGRQRSLVGRMRRQIEEIVSSR